MVEHYEPNQLKKLNAFRNRMFKHFEYLFTFLDNINVPPDNNASERGIRNVKVKLKVSGQFNSEKGALNFARIRSVIDTAIKNNTNVFQAINAVQFYIPE